MSEEEKFDELLSSKLSERDFPFDELNWDEAERLIIQQEKKKKTARFALIFSGGLLAGVLIMLPFIILSHHTDSGIQVSTSTIHQSPITQGIAPRPINEKESPTPVHSAFVSTTIRTGKGGNHIQPSSNTGVSRKASVAATISNVAETPAPNNTIVAATIPVQNVLTPKTSNTRTADIETVNQSQVNPSATEEIAISSQQTVTKNIATNEPLPVKKDTSKLSKPVKDPVKPVTNTDRVYTPGLALNPAVNNSSSKPPDSTANKTPQANPDDIPKYKTGDLHKNILSAYAGGNYSFGWYYNGPAKEYLQGNGITPWGGIMYTHYFTGAIALSLGAGYSEIVNLNQTYNSSIFQYDFGENSNVTTVTPQKVYYMAFPLKLQYDIDDKNLIGIGCDYMLMMTTYSTLTTYKQNYFSETPGSSVKQNGYTQGFSNSYWEFMISYTRMLTARFGASIEYYRDLGYVENNSISALSQTEKNSGLRIVLSYQILK